MSQQMSRDARVKSMRAANNVLTPPTPTIIRGTGIKANLINLKKKKKKQA